MSNQQTGNNNSIGTAIGKALSEGLRTGDFSGLNDAITNSVEQTLDEVGRKLSITVSPEDEKGIRLSQRPIPQQPTNYTQVRQAQLQREQAILRAQNQERLRQRQADKAAKAAATNKVATVNKQYLTTMRPVGDVSGVLMSVFGGLGTGVFSITSVTALMKMAFANATSVSAGFVFSGLACAASAFFLVRGIGKSRRVNRAKRYVQLCGDRKMCEIDRICSATGRSKHWIVKDIRKMLVQGFFPQGYLDEDGTVLILSDDVFKEYMKSKIAPIDKSNNGKDIIDTTAREVSEQEAEMNAVIRDGENYIAKIRELNDRLPGEVISEKLDTLETLLRQIFARLSEEPEQIGRMHKLMDYYLPTTLKLVEAYERYERVEIPGDDIIHAKEEIENTLDTINRAFVQLHNNLFQENVWDVTTDAQVLTTMLAKEGLTSSVDDKKNKQ